MFIAAVFTVAKVWKQSKCPPTDKGKKKRWYGSVDEESCCKEGDFLQCRIPRFDPWVRKSPWRWRWQTTAVILPGSSPGQKSPAHCSVGWLWHDWSQWAVMHATYIHAVKGYLARNQYRLAICDNMGETRGYYAKGNKLRERHCMVLLVCRMWKTTNEQT